MKGESVRLVLGVVLAVLLLVPCLILGGNFGQTGDLAS
jgi:hypothetical protein